MIRKSAHRAWILKYPEAEAYSYIFDSLEAAERKNKKMGGRLWIIKVKVTELVYEH